MEHGVGQNGRGIQSGTRLSTWPLPEKQLRHIDREAEDDLAAGFHRHIFYASLNLLREAFD
jgi:hypothetical protein